MSFALRLDLAPMEARSAADLPEDGAWQFEPKWDGFRCLAFKSGSQVDLRAKSGKPLGRYFPEMVAALQEAPADDFVLDGELTIMRDGHLSFAALQDRLHPAASRISKLAAATPAQLVLFDCLASPAGSLLAQPRGAGGGRGRPSSVRPVPPDPVHPRPRGGAGLARPRRG
ncbi:MAG: hypothetical protein NVS2B11_02090 [Acetobacteraceae bacterium]